MSIDKFMSKKIEGWLVGLIVVTLILGGLAFGIIVHHTAFGGKRFGVIGKAAFAIASLPAEATREFKMLMSGDLAGMSTLHSDRFEGRSGWTFFDIRLESELDGYLLFSRHVVDLKAGDTVHRINLDATRIFKNARKDSRFTEIDSWTPKRFQAMHPIALDNGDIIFKGFRTALARITPCGEPVWVQDKYIFHHTIERGPDGHFWTSSYVEPQRVEGLHYRFLDPGIVQFTEDGEILYDESLTEVMLRQGLGYQILADQDFYHDPLHLNDVQPVFEDGPFWKRGDVFLSLRHTSTIMLYRPSTDSVIWWKQGPWAAQHDVDIIDQSTIGIYNNNTYDYGSGGFVDGHTHINYYDFKTDSVTSPFKEALAEQEVKNEAAGLFTLIPDGHYYVDESESGRTLIFTPDGELAVEHINRAENGLIYHLGWSRYMSRMEGDNFLSKLKAANCPRES
jgi:hypothetical protein